MHNFEFAGTRILCVVYFFNTLNKFHFHRNSPMDFLGSHIRIWQFFGMFDVDTDSKLIKILLKLHNFITQWVFVFFGCTIQTMALLNSSSMKESIQILFIAVAYMNACVKTYLVCNKKEEVQQLFAKLNAPEFKALNAEEKAYVTDQNLKFTNQ